MSVEVVYRGEQPFARRGNEEWALGDVTRGEMRFSPDGRKFAYVRQRKDAPSAQAARVLVRNLAGDPVNEFAVFRPGVPEALTWIDNRHIGYLAPPEPVRDPRRSGMYVVHDAQTGEVMSARSGTDFCWGPDRKHVAFLSGAPGRQTVVVDGRTVWPRRGITSPHGAPVWSPDGHGLALVDTNQGAPPRLVVLVEYDDPQGDLTWPIPKDALSSGLRVFWAGDSKVVIGESALRPKFAAGWERLK